MTRFTESHRRRKKPSGGGRLLAATSLMTAEQPGTIRQGISLNPDPVQAVRELFDAIFLPSAGLTVVFCSSRYDRHALELALQETFAGAPLVGCTTAGEISPHGYTMGGLAGISIAREACISVSRLIPAVSSFDAGDGRDVSHALFEDLRRQGVEPSHHTTFGMLMIDGSRLVEERVISSLSASLSPLSLFGGSASNCTFNGETLVFHDGRFYGDAAILTLIHTHLPFKVFSSQQFVGSNDQLIVTGADPERRIVTELNGEPAAFEYARRLGWNISQLRSDGALLPPLVVRVGGSWHTRSVRGLTADGGLELACAIDEGVPLSVGHNTGMLENLRSLFEDIQGAVGHPHAVLGFDCIMRRIEADTVNIKPELRDLFAQYHVVGCSTFGEQFNGLHCNHTFTGVAFGFGSAETKGRGMPPAPQETELGKLEKENAKLRKTVRVLLQRVERSMNAQGDSFSLFQNNVLLEATVRRRTEELAELNRQLTQELIARRETEAALVAAKAEAESANASKSDFMAAISHDLQQPLNAARLLLGALLEESLSGPGRAILDRIEGALEAAEEMLADSLEVAMLEAGGLTPRLTQFPIASLLAQVEAEYAPQARRVGLQLKVLPCSALVWTDRSLLQRVVRNLLANAIRYTPEGRILVGCRRRGEELLVGVYDTGVGIPEDKKMEVFKPFRRLGPGSRDRSGGSGLGLTIVDKITQALGLSVEMRSTEGLGSAFLVGVPLADMMAARTPEAMPVPRSAAILSGKKILVVDDDPLSVEGLERILSAWGCVTLMSMSIAEAIERARSGPELIIVDYHLGDDKTGLDALDEMRQVMGVCPPALVVTADTSQAVQEQIRRRGHEFVAKPISPARLRSALTYLFCCRPSA